MRFFFFNLLNYGFNRQLFDNSVFLYGPWTEPCDWSEDVRSRVSEPLTFSTRLSDPSFCYFHVDGLFLKSHLFFDTFPGFGQKHCLNLDPSINTLYSKLCVWYSHLIYSFNFGIFPVFTSLKICSTFDHIGSSCSPRRCLQRQDSDLLTWSWKRLVWQRLHWCLHSTLAPTAPYQDFCLEFCLDVSFSFATVILVGRQPRVSRDCVFWPRACYHPNTD